MIGPAIGELLLVVCLAVHLTSMNLAGALPLFAWLLPRLRGSSGSSPTTDLAQTSSAVSVSSIADSNRLTACALQAFGVGILAGLGVGGILWLLGDRALFRLWEPFRYKLWWGVGELVFYVVCLVLFLYLGRGDAASISRPRHAGRVLLLFLAATNLLYHFPPLFSILARAAHDPSSITGPVGPREFRQLMVQGHIIPLTVHFVLASFAVAGTALLPALVRSAAAEAEHAPMWRRLQLASARVALGTTVLQLVVGLWLLLSLPASTQRALLGNDGLATAALGTSLLASFGLMHLLAAASFGEISVAESRRLNVVMGTVILLMTFVLHRLHH